MRLSSGLRLGDIIKAGAAAGYTGTLTNDLVSWWSLDEESGTRADSITATGADLSDNNTVLYDTGMNGNAASFTSGNSESLSVTPAPDLGAADHDYTVSLWMNAGVLSGERALAALPYDTAIRGLIYCNGTSLIHAHRGSSVTWGAALEVSTWYHVVATYNAAASSGQIIVNDGTPVSGALADSEAPGTLKFCLGAYANANAGLYTGLIDEVGLWSRVLTAGEISELYASGSGVFYPFT